MTIVDTTTPTTTDEMTYALPMQHDVALFHRAFDMPDLILTPGPLPLDRIDLRIKLIREEGVQELREAIEERDAVKIVDALIDTVYVALGALVEMGYRVDEQLGLDQPRSVDALTGSLLNLGLGNASSTELYLALLEPAFRRQDLERAAGILQAITTGAILTLLKSGIDPRPFFDVVQASNMSKLGIDGRPVHSRGEELDGEPLGKVLKGPNYVRAEIGLAQAFQTLYGDPRAFLEYFKVSGDFARGARAAADAMRFYFLDENEHPLYAITAGDLESHERDAVTDVLRAEQNRLELAE